MLKKSGIIGLSVLFLMLTVFTGCEQKKVSGEKSTCKIAGILPETTKMLVKFSSLDDFYKIFNVQAEKVMGNNIPDLDDAVKYLGFNPLDINQIKNLGISTSNEFGLALENLDFGNDDSKTFNGAIYFPVENPKLAEEKLAKYFTDLKNEKDGTKIETKITTANGITCVAFGKEKINLYWTIKDNFIFMSLSTQNQNYISKLQNYKGKTLKDNANFKSTLKNVSLNENLYLYADMGTLLDAKTLNMLQQYSNKPVGIDAKKIMDLYKCYKGMAINVNLESKDLISHSVVDLKKDSDIEKLFKNKINRKILHTMKKNPLLIFSFTVNIPEYYKFIKKFIGQENIAEFDNKIKMIKKEFGIDVENDIINNLGGNMGLGIYDGASINMLNYNALISFDLKDGKKFNTTLGKLITLLPPSQRKMVTESKIGNSSAYVFNQGMIQYYAGITDNSFVFTLGKALYEEAIAKNGDTLKNVDNSLKESMKSANSYFYVSFDELLKAYNNFSGMIQAVAPNKISDKIVKGVSKLNYMYFDSSLKNNSVACKFILKTRFDKPFFIALADLMKETQEKTAQPVK